MYNSIKHNIDSTKKSNRLFAESLIRGIGNIYHVGADIWPLVPSKDADQYSIQDVIDNPEKYKYAFGNEGGWYKSDIRLSTKYQEYFKQEMECIKAERVFDSIYNEVMYNPVAHESWDNDKKNEVWEKYKSPSKLLMSEFKSYRWIALEIALAVSIAAFFSNKQSLGKLHEKLLRFLEQLKFGFGGSARFAGLLEEWCVLFKNQKNGLFMGRSLYNPFLNIGLEDDRHMLTIAGSRAGKGATVIIPNLLLWEGSALVIDPKGTNAAVTAKRRKAMGHNVYLIDPFKVINHRDTASFNPLEMLDINSPTIREQINIIAEALVVPDPNQKEKHWDDGAKTVIAGLIAQLVSSGAIAKPTLPMLRDLISAMPDAQTDLWAAMSINNKAGRLAKDAAHRIINGIGNSEISGILSNADKHTEWLSSPAMEKTLSSSSFKFSDLKEKPTTIYLIIPPQYLETHNRFLRLFINLAISQMSIGGKSKVPVLLLMDEFLALGKMEEVEKAFGLMAGYNLILWPFVQDLGRLKNLYGSGVNTFIANSRAIQVFGVADEETKTFVSNYVGERYLAETIRGSRRTEVVKLRDTSEVAKDIERDSNRQYILRAGKAPLVIERVKYFDSVPIRWLAPFESLGAKRLGIFHGLYDTDPDYK